MLIHFRGTFSMCSPCLFFLSFNFCESMCQTRELCVPTAYAMEFKNGIFKFLLGSISFILFAVFFLLCFLRRMTVASSGRVVHTRQLSILLRFPLFAYILTTFHIICQALLLLGYCYCLPYHLLSFPNFSLTYLLCIYIEHLHTYYFRLPGKQKMGKYIIYTRECRKSCKKKSIKVLN